MKKRRVKIVLTKDGKKVAACAAAVVVLLALLLFFALFKVDSVSVVGSTRYSDEEIRQMAMGSPLDSNTLLAVWLHRQQEAEDIPFVESFDLEMLDAVAARCPVPIIASGGAGRQEDFAELFLHHPGVDAGLAASIFHSKQVEIRPLKEYLRALGVEMRL